jgi:asparagine synthase (glutamine-hydrolysing)
MCGIAGLFDTRGMMAFDDALIVRMTDAVAHRGPDGSGIYNKPGIALGHRRLSIIDLAGGHQPMHTAEGDLTIVFNGEIYNFQALRGELAALGAVFLTNSDTEVLLHGWRHWKTGMLAKLHGMFAFALWDARDQTLFLARDRFGKKPLHYALLNDGTLVFGSEIKSILCHLGVGRTIDNQAASDFFTYGYVPDPKTIYTTIRKLPPAHYAIARRGRAIEFRPYWNVLESLDQESPPGESQLIEHLKAAVGSRLISDVPLGALLSGGVDSSAIVALMAGVSNSQINTFSIAFDDPAFDESNHARAVAAQYGTQHVEQTVDPDDFSLLARLPEIYDEPFGDVSAIPTFRVCALARRSVTVALSGDGGDEALAGYRRYAFHVAEERIRSRVPAAIRKAVLAPLAGLYPHGSWLPKMLRAKTTLRELSLDAAGAYASMVAALPDNIRDPLLSPAFRASLGGYRSEDVVRDHFNVDAKLDPVQRAQYADVMTYLPGDILVKVDRASMANSLEMRAPFLDGEFFSWAFTQPLSAKLNGHSGKAILKRAMEPYLPHEILYRPKQGFTVPLARWFREELRGNILELSQNSRLRDSGIVDLDTVAAMAKAHVSGRRDFSKPLWLVWVFSAFLDHRPA